jgi:hypothetical protein
MSSYSIILLIDEQLLYYTAHHWAVATSISTYIVTSLPLPLYCGILLLAKQHETKLVSILYYSSMSSSCIILLINEQLRLPCLGGNPEKGVVTTWPPLFSPRNPDVSHSLRPYKVFLAASCRLWLRHHADFTCCIMLNAPAAQRTNRPARRAE